MTDVKVLTAHAYGAANGILRHSFLRVGEDISLLHFIAPSFEFLLCLSVYKTKIVNLKSKVALLSSKRYNEKHVCPKKIFNTKQNIFNSCE